MVTLDDGFLAALGLAPAPPGAEPAGTDLGLADDPALWAMPTPDDLAERIAATRGELAEVVERIAQGEQAIGEREQTGQPVPSSWRARLLQLRNQRGKLRNALAEQCGKACATVQEIEARLLAQWGWLQTTPESDPGFAEREAVWRAWLARYEALVLAAQAMPDDDEDVSWTRAWDRLRALGFTSRAEVERAIGGWSADPREVVSRAMAARRQRLGAVNLSRPRGPRLPPVRASRSSESLACFACGKPGRALGVPCEHCGALPVVARREERSHERSN